MIPWVFASWSLVSFSSSGNFKILALWLFFSLVFSLMELLLNRGWDLRICPLRLFPFSNLPCLCPSELCSGKKKGNPLVSSSSSRLRSWGAPVSGVFASWSSQFHFQGSSLFKIPACSYFRPVMGNPLLSLWRLGIFSKSCFLLLTQFTQVLAFSVVPFVVPLAWH